MSIDRRPLSVFSRVFGRNWSRGELRKYGALLPSARTSRRMHRQKVPACLQPGRFSDILEVTVL